MVLTMQKTSDIWKIEDYSTLKKNSGVGISAQTRSINVEGHLLVAHFYPLGKDNDSSYHESMSFSIEKTVAEGGVDEEIDIMYGVEILNQYHYGLPVTHSSFRSRGIFRHVAHLVGGPRVGKIDFYRPSIEASFFRYIKGDSIKVRISIGLIRDADQGQQNEPVLLYTVGDTRFCAEESVIRRECPRLLDIHNFPNISPDMFDGILWYLYQNKKKVHEKDLKAITASVHLDPNSYSAKMRSTAIYLELDHLRRVCESIMRTKDLAIHKMCFPIESCFSKCC